MSRFLHIRDQETRLFGRRFLNSQLSLYLGLIQLVVCVWAFAQHIYSIVVFDQILYCDFSTNSTLPAVWTGVDIIIFDVGLFHSLWGIHGCVAQHLDGGYGRFAWCVSHCAALVMCLPCAFLRRPKPYYLWPLLVQQSAYGVGLLILSLAALPRILPTFMGELNNAPMGAILTYVLGTLLNFFLLYIYWHWYWHVEAEYDAARKLRAAANADPAHTASATNPQRRGLDLDANFNQTRKQPITGHPSLNGRPLLNGSLNNNNNKSATHNGFVNADTTSFSDEKVDETSTPHGLVAELKVVDEPSQRLVNGPPSRSVDAPTSQRFLNGSPNHRRLVDGSPIQRPADVSPCQRLVNGSPNHRRFVNVSPSQRFVDLPPSQRPVNASPSQQRFSDGSPSRWFVDDSPHSRFVDPNQRLPIADSPDDSVVGSPGRPRLSPAAPRASPHHQQHSSRGSSGRATASPATRGAARSSAARRVSLVEVGESAATVRASPEGAGRRRGRVAADSSPPASTNSSSADSSSCAPPPRRRRLPDGATSSRRCRPHGPPRLVHAASPLPMDLQQRLVHQLHHHIHAQQHQLHLQQRPLGSSFSSHSSMLSLLGPRAATSRDVLALPKRFDSADSAARSIPSSRSGPAAHEMTGLSTPSTATPVSTPLLNAHHSATPLPLACLGPTARRLRPTRARLAPAHTPDAWTDRVGFGESVNGFKGVANAFGEPVNAFASPVNAFNDSVNAFTDTVSPFASPVNAFNDPVNAFNDPVNAFNDPVHAFSDPVDMFSEPVSAFTSPVNAFDDALDEPPHAPSRATRASSSPRQTLR